MTTPTVSALPADPTLLRDVARSVRTTVLLADPIYVEGAITALARATVESERNVRWPNVSWVAGSYPAGELRNQAREAIAEAAAIADRLRRLSRDELLGHLAFLADDATTADQEAAA